MYLAKHVHKASLAYDRTIFQRKSGGRPPQSKSAGNLRWLHQPALAHGLFVCSLALSKRAVGTSVLPHHFP